MKYKQIFIGAVLFYSFIVASGCNNTSDTNTLELKSLDSNPVVKTGQTDSFIIGDDGYYQKGADRNYTRDDNSEVISDHTSGLMWQDNGYEKKTWSKAVLYCDNLVLAEFDDWRLPSVQELVYLTDKGLYDAAIDLKFKSIVSSPYWSATTKDKGSIESAWLVDFQDGNDYLYSKNQNYYYVRCVRGEALSESSIVRDSTLQTVSDSKTGLLWQDDEDVVSVQKNWSDAISYCENLNFADSDKWRLPNFNELYSISKQDRVNPALDTTLFLHINSDQYWSSTTYNFPLNSSFSWNLDFDYGEAYYSDKNDTLYVRCVTDLQ